MHTIIRKRFTAEQMGKLFLHSGALTVKYYACIGEYSETGINHYEIQFRHSESTPPTDTNIDKILSLPEQII